MPETPPVPAAATWPVVLGPLLAHESLSQDSARWAMDQIMAGNATDAQIAAFAVAMRSKGETAEELSGLVAAMLGRAHRFEVVGPAVDVVGTGGDRAQTVNISTMAALVVAGTGATVVKHGNRAASSACGAADLLEQLGVRLTLTPEQVADVAREVGITFCFAQVFHPAMRHTAAARRELGVPTVFNFLGPLTNPAQPVAQAVGCGDARMAEVMAGVFAGRGVSALVFRGDDGLDELTTTTTSQVWRVAAGAVRREVVDPARLGLAPASVADLKGADPAHNAGVAEALLAGDRGPVRDAVVLNAAAALVSLRDAAGQAQRPLHDSLADAMEVAAAAIDSGAAEDTLNRWVSATQRF
jgi:anthranilate phosphoribosyltransferase